MNVAILVSIGEHRLNPQFSSRVPPVFLHVAVPSCEDEHWPGVDRVHASSELAVWYDAPVLAQVVSRRPFLTSSLRHSQFPSRGLPGFGLLPKYPQLCAGAQAV